MALDKRATDKRRIQDTDGDVLGISGEGHITADNWQEKELSAGELIIAHKYVIGLTAGSTCTLGGSTCSIHDLHVTMTVSTTGQARVELFEDATYTGGVVIQQLNMNRQKSLPCGNVVYVSSPTVTDDGLLLLTVQSGSAGYKTQVAGSASMEGWIFKKDKKYILKIHNESTEAINFSVIVVYHEHNGT